MASATGLPRRPPNGAEADDAAPTGETEPLLGRPGDAAQLEGAAYWTNLTLGTAVLAQFGAVILLGIVWASVFTGPLILFSAHPLAQSLAVFVLVQSVLFLQPTHTAAQKRAGRRVHAALNLAALLLLVFGVAVVEYNKVAGGNPHFHSVHAYFGVATCVVLVVQYFVGFTMWATPALYGGEARARALWRWHRVFAYAVVLPLLLVTVFFTAYTPYNVGILKMKWWGLLIALVLVVVGVYPRTPLHKIRNSKQNGTLSPSN
ncbi:Protein arginine N-methyltransferase [Purpureocillium lavendulum]|uniref:Protein arginine N-methyltransferase n=1 Tax=Purpureocillium lavendulum TaxID=1247861 RepID=A0AB34FU25_9HYPO|nr:Protein arginine N-methyltransferase [Purpureocillium lavendulum]